MKIDRPIAIALMLFLTLVLVFFLVAPEFRLFRKLQFEIAEKEALYNAEFEYYSEIKSKYDELTSRPEDLKKIDNALPSEPNLGKIIYYFEKTSIENGLILMDVFLADSKLNAATGKKDSVNTKDLVFSIDLMGTYASLGKFLSSLEKSDRIFEVITIFFGTGENQVFDANVSYQPQAEKMYNFNLQIKTHSY